MSKYWFGVFERICLNPRTTAAGVASAVGLGAYVFGLNIDANVVYRGFLANTTVCIYYFLPLVFF